MKGFSILGSTAIVCVLTAGVGAQAQAGTAGQDNRATQQDRITVIGCLQPGVSGAGSVGTSGTTSPKSSGAAGGFLLTNAFIGGAPGGGSGVNSPTPPGSGSTESAARVGATPPGPTTTPAAAGNRGGGTNPGSTYALRGDTTELTRHVGQQVEISGRISSRANASGGNGASASGAPANGASTAPVTPSRNDRPTTSGGSADATGSATGSSVTQTIEVTALRMVGTICAQQ